ncbi:hypothetical protein BSL78_01869 [Apostichopus japonicus]|uniref:Uncharacterized protein n=1 Tax=Stichopus japonicus TaxID=307972 RepID=A0A2G8LLT7_STIJA|nr:hypothetical protein BSL78_01869 [Apostichopus japonicus]
MLRTIQNLPKVLRAHTPCSSNRKNPSQTPAPVLIERASDHSSEPDRKLCVKPPGHVTDRTISRFLISSRKIVIMKISPNSSAGSPIGGSTQNLKGSAGAIARSIISNEHSLADSSTASSVSFSSGDEDCSQDLSICSSGEEASSRKDGGVLDEKQSKFGDEETAGDELKQDYQQQSLSTDEILPALEGALVHLRKTSQKRRE